MQILCSSQAARGTLGVSLYRHMGCTYTKVLASGAPDFRESASSYFGRKEVRIALEARAVGMTTCVLSSPQGDGVGTGGHWALGTCLLRLLTEQERKTGNYLQCASDPAC